MQTSTETSTVPTAVLSEALEESRQRHMRAQAIEVLACDYGHRVTLRSLVDILNAEKEDYLGDITLDELLKARAASLAPEEGEPSKKAPSKKKTASKKAGTRTRTKIDREAGYAALTKVAEDSDEGLRFSAFVEGTGISEGHVRTMIKELVSEGKLVTAGKGPGTTYSLA